MLQDRAHYLENHYQVLQEKNTHAELLDAWLDFSALKQKARPKSDLIGKHFISMIKTKTDDPQAEWLIGLWEEHLKVPYQENTVPNELLDYFNGLENCKSNEKLLKQWQSYCSPDEKTDADWEYVKKPEAGYLVPIMVGYKAISEVYKNKEIENTRDNETPVCFVEAAHSIGEWQSAHRIRSVEELNNCLWHYHHEKNWYLCKQNNTAFANENTEPQLEIVTENPNDDFS
ncbi:MAG: hypothetical protein JKY55_17485 [Aliivibrio sp.]|uniref:type I-F CRISPR-associated protein Csy2 n=1 Tax=Aliivibrio sp. TaxID=1872443 RepID=UPI001A3963EB|nr:hypothetical protein [Aliivibrio sp.]